MLINRARSPSGGQAGDGSGSGVNIPFKLITSRIVAVTECAKRGDGVLRLQKSCRRRGRWTGRVGVGEMEGEVLQTDEKKGVQGDVGLVWWGLGLALAKPC